ncbi:hypothetical protein E2C01_068962 [Portunus trituberculatus]|uniref:Uncharacterized protein n=1 Tax=Portunus trituberculatus TaxID=210409 RepID=A0A5B7HXY5_PORTR|nr:hypothetical protein [Portunus trituberculatus]
MDERDLASAAARDVRSRHPAVLQEAAAAHCLLLSRAAGHSHSSTRYSSQQYAQCLWNSRGAAAAAHVLPRAGEAQAGVETGRTLFAGESFTARSTSAADTRSA